MGTAGADLERAHFAWPRTFLECLKAEPPLLVQPPPPLKLVADKELLGRVPGDD